ncbi:MAG: hypothetical protein LZ167_01355 [Thaumarchaeota archaeon]|nr:hypothetical protein [Candidatus Geocrenenecus arthurdayi]
MVEYYCPLLEVFEEPLYPPLTDSFVLSMAIHLLYLGSLETLIVDTFLASPCTVDLLIGSNARLRTLEAFLQHHKTYNPILLKP